VFIGNTLYSLVHMRVGIVANYSRKALHFYFKAERIALSV